MTFAYEIEVTSCSQPSRAFALLLALHRSDREAKKAGNPRIQEDDRLAHRNEVVAEMFKNETDDVKEEVAKYISEFDAKSVTLPVIPGEEGLSLAERARLNKCRGKQV